MLYPEATPGIISTQIVSSIPRKETTRTEVSRIVIPGMNIVDSIYTQKKALPGNSILAKA